MFNKLKREYEVFTPKSMDEIFAEIAAKRELQKKENNLFNSDPIRYNSFKISKNQIEIERWPWMFNPYRGTGTIYFHLEPRENGARIKCSIEVMSRYSLAFGLGMHLFFLLIFSAIIIVVLRKNLTTLLLFLAGMWVMVPLPSFLMFRLFRNNLEIYSETILKDLGIKVNKETNTQTNENL